MWILNKSNWNLAIYRSSVEGGDACNSNPLSCYHGIAESQLTLNNCDGNGDTHLNYQWRIPLAHYIDATDTGKFANDDWKVEMKVVDDASGSYTSHSYFEVATLRAVSVVDDIEYGSLGAGSESIEKKLLITNTGNDPIDLNVRADGPMICEKGEIPAENIHVGFVEGFDYGKPEIAMKKEDQYLNVSIPKRIGNEVSQKTIYLKLLAPVNGVHGRCMNSITFTAVQDK